jgi:lipoate-protein ligase A
MGKEKVVLITPYLSEADLHARLTGSLASFLSPMTFPMFEHLDLILPEKAFNGAMQMALDEVLLPLVKMPTLRIYHWEAPCVTFGYFQKHSEVRSLHPAMEVVRRWTGGGMVVHGEDLTFSLMVPELHPAASMRPSLFYKLLHASLGEWLKKRLPKGIRMACPEDVTNGPACFAAPALDDLLVGGRKILGGAQRRSHGALLYQGSLQCRDLGTFDPSNMGAALSASETLRLLDEYRWNNNDDNGYDNDLLKSAERIAEARYSCREWNERR